VNLWAAEVLQVMTESKQLFSGGLPQEQGPMLAARASALLDRGRFYFPNIPYTRDDEVVAARDGYRPAILDLLRLLYRILELGEGKDPERGKAVDELQKVFVIAVYRSLEMGRVRSAAGLRKKLRETKVDEVRNACRRLAGAEHEGFELRFIPDEQVHSATSGR